MTFVRDIYDFLDRAAPFASQMEGDNSGLQIGDFTQQVRRCMLCLDITPGVVAQAAQTSCELIVAHHPVMYTPRRQLLSSDPAWLLARHGIAAIASHTPLDRCPGGVNDVLAQTLDLGEVDPSTEMYRLCRLPEPVTAKALAAQVKERLSAAVRYCDAGKIITTVAVCGGNGGGFLEEIAGLADAFVTGEAKHSDFLQAEAMGITLLAAGHFETEAPVIPALAVWLREAFPAVAWHIANEYGAKHA